MAAGLSLSVVRKHCLECSGDSFKAVLWCPVSDCNLWRFRLGVKPATLRAKHGPALVTPRLMPPATVDLDNLPNGIEAAAEYLREPATSKG